MDFDDDMMEEFETIIVNDEESGEDIEFAIIDSLKSDKSEYILVIEADCIDDEDAEATILKKIDEGDDDIAYELIEDDEEFDKIAALFQQSGGDYDVEVDE